jgi:L-iditol 2-dehydrogenase
VPFVTIVSARAAIIREPGTDLEVVDVPVPPLPPGGILVEVEAATVCGTDLEIWRNPGSRRFAPFIPGHESAGIVVDINGEHTDVDGEPVRVGDRVIWGYPYCGECYYCTTAGQPSLCENAVRFGRARADIAPYLLGGFATHQYVPPLSGVVKVPDSVDPALAASASCALRTVMHAFDRLGPVAGHEVCVVQGSGPIGLYATAVARSAGFSSVYCIGAPPDRLEIAKAFGADEVIDVGQTTADERLAWVRDRTGGRGGDVVLQCASGSAIPESLAMARPGARVVSVGAGGADELTVPALSLHGKMLTISGVRAATIKHYSQAIEFLAKGGVPFELMTSGPRYELGTATDALRAMAALTEVKPVLLPAGVRA